jgi:aspartyl-tRNA(Asn)/glutamyl-tRNA(Gln) amidotransferase subunit A
VPSSFCGIFGLKPTYGRLSRARSFPFVASFDHLGPFARNVGDLALAYDAMQGPDADDAVQRAPSRPVAPMLFAGYRRTSHRHCRRIFPEQRLPRSGRGRRPRRQRAGRHANDRNSRGRARAPPPMSSHHRSASLHLDRLRRRRTIRSGGARPPAGRRHGSAPLVDRAQKFRRWYRAPRCWAVQDGRRDHRAGDAHRRAETGAGDLRARWRRLPVRANIGIHQPISFIRLPVVAAPVPLQPMPIRVQIIAAPWREISRCAQPSRWSAPAWLPHRSERVYRMDVDLPDVLAE